MVAFEDAKGNKLALSMHFSHGHDSCVDILSYEDCVFDFAKLYAESVKLDLIILSAEASVAQLVVGHCCDGYAYSRLPSSAHRAKSPVL